MRPLLEILPDRIVPTTTQNVYFAPSVAGNYNASVVNNWDVGGLGSNVHPAKAPGMTAGETDNIYFDGGTQNGRNGNQSCTWNYTPTNDLGSVTFQNGYNQTVTFSPMFGFSVSSNSLVTQGSAPTLTHSGATGAVAAITLTGGVNFKVNTGGTLFLTGDSKGNAIFFAGDKTQGEFLNNNGTVVYTGQPSTGTSYVDYLKIPVRNNDTGVFKVNGNGVGGNTNAGATLQVSGADSFWTEGVSFYQSFSTAETDIYGNGTLWCVNDYTMEFGLLQTLDSYTDYLKVGVGGDSPVDGAVNLLGGSVNINPKMSGTAYGTLEIMGTTQPNNPILNVGSSTLNFKVNMAAGSTQCDQLIVGGSGGTGKVNFGYQGGTATIFLIAQGDVTTGHKWPVLYYGKNMVTNTDHVQISQQNQGYSLNWKNPNYLEIDY